MSVINLNVKQTEKRIKELRMFLHELDVIADNLYNRLEFAGVWDTLMKLEDIRARYYVEYYEHEQLLKDKVDVKR